MGELEHVTFGDQPVTEIDALDGKVVAAAIDKPPAIGMNEVRRRGDRRPGEERGEERNCAGAHRQPGLKQHFVAPADRKNYSKVKIRQ
jgi:hypothetical protein